MTRIKRNALYPLGLTLVVLAVLAVIPAAAQTVANGPYYATPSWDQTLAPSTRFIVLSNMNSEAVLDRETGLVWQRTPANLNVVYEGALQICAQARTGGRLGWRVPSLHESLSLLDPSVVANAGQVVLGLPPGHPFGPIPAGQYWTGTSRILFPGLAWVVDPFPAGPAPGLGLPPTGCCASGPTIAKTEAHRIWCVRAPGTITEN